MSGKVDARAEIAKIFGINSEMLEGAILSVSDVSLARDKAQEGFDVYIRVRLASGAEHHMRVRPVPPMDLGDLTLRSQAKLDR